MLKETILEQIILEEIERAIDEGLFDSLKSTVAPYGLAAMAALSPIGSAMAEPLTDTEATAQITSTLNKKAEKLNLKTPGTGLLVQFQEEDPRMSDLGDKSSQLTQFDESDEKVDRLLDLASNAILNTVKKGHEPFQAVDAATDWVEKKVKDRKKEAAKAKKKSRSKRVDKYDVSNHPYLVHQEVYGYFDKMNKGEPHDKAVIALKKRIDAAKKDGQLSSEQEAEIFRLMSQSKKPADIWKEIGVYLQVPGF